jgi:putative two-component system response regulator
MGIAIARSHHEKWDGSGYPDGLAGEDIPLAGRIMALSDVYDALRSNRVYKPAFLHDKTCAIITEGGGRHFDPAVVKAFTAVEAQMAAIREQMNAGSAGERVTSNE